MPRSFGRTTVGSDNDYSYTDKLSGRRRAFTPKANEAVVTFQEQPSEDVLNEVTRATPLTISQGFDLERGFAAVQVTSDRDMGSATRSLLERPEIANALPAMVDGDGLTRYFLPDELTVQFKPEVSPARAEELIADHGGRVLFRQRTPGYYTISVAEGRGLFESIREYSDLPEVAFAEPSEVSFNSALDYLPDDPDFGRLWGLHNTGQTVNGVAGTADTDIDMPAAWDLERGDPEVIVAVIDTGADLDHPDLQANLLPRGTEDWDFADTGDPSPDDDDGHGTHVAGTAAAADNQVGVIGVAPGCRIMPLRVNLTTGMNQNRADAINYVAAQAMANPDRRFVINCSWRMNGDHAGVHNAIINAVSSNVVVVYAAGNDNNNIDVTPQFPAVYPEVIAVAATDQNDRRATFSNFGQAVDVSAPGVNIYSSFPDDNFAFLDGTSMASPHVAGLAALIWSHNRTLSNQQVRETIEATCDNIDAANPGFVGLLGRGRVNAHRALTSLGRRRGVAVFGRDPAGDKKSLYAVTTQGRLAQLFDTTKWNLDFPAEAASQPNLRFQSAAAVFGRNPGTNKKSVYLVTSQGRLAQVFDTTGWNLDFPAEKASQPNLRFAGGPAVFGRDAAANKKSIYAITTEGRLAQIWDTTRWNLDFPAELAGQPNLRFQGSPAVFGRDPATNKKSLYAITADGRLIQVWDTSKWNHDFPAAAAGQPNLRFQGSPAVFGRDPAGNKKSIYAITTDGRLAQLWDSTQWNIDFPAEATSQPNLRFQDSPAVFGRDPAGNKKSLYVVTTDGRLAQLWDSTQWKVDFPAELAGQAGLRFPGTPAVFGRDPAGNKKSIYAVTTNGRLVQIWDTTQWNLGFPAELANAGSLRFQP
jgi:subtilisin family serine protease